MEGVFSKGDIARRWYKAITGAAIPYEWIGQAEKESVREYWRERYGTDEGFDALWASSTGLTKNAKRLRRSSSDCIIIGDWE